MSSINKLHLVAQESLAEIITHNSNVLDFTGALVVNRTELADAYRDVQSVSRQLHRVESFSNLDWQKIEDLCRTIHHAAGLLEGMLDAQKKGGVR